MHDVSPSEVREVAEKASTHTVHRRYDLTLICGDLHEVLVDCESVPVVFDNWEVGLFYQDLEDKRWYVQLGHKSALRSTHTGQNHLGFGVRHTAETGLLLHPNDVISYRRIPGTKDPDPARNHLEVRLDFHSRADFEQPDR